MNETVMSNPRWRVRALAGLGLTLLVDPALPADKAIRTERVQFKKGASSAIVNGRIRGYEVIDYLVTAQQGQYANISLATRHTATYFNLLAPGQTEVAFFNGSTSENLYEGNLPADGGYRIRVYMMRSAARRNEVADYRLEIDSAPLAGALAASMERDMAGANSWVVDLDSDGGLRWTSDAGTLTRQPARNLWQRVENLLFKLVPPNLY
jgi:hypothetical protein